MGGREREIGKEREREKRREREREKERKREREKERKRERDIHLGACLDLSTMDSTPTPRDKLKQCGRALLAFISGIYPHH